MVDSALKWLLWTREIRRKLSRVYYYVGADSRKTNTVIRGNDGNEEPFQYVLLHRLVGIFAIQPRHDKTNYVALRPGCIQDFSKEGVGVRFAYFISFFLNILRKWNNLVSLRPNYFIFKGYLRTWSGEGVQANSPNPIWIHHWRNRKTQVSLCISSVWLESLLFVWRTHGSLLTNWVHSEDSDQITRMPRLIWVFGLNIFYSSWFVYCRCSLKQ